VAVTAAAWPGQKSGKCSQFQRLPHVELAEVPLYIIGHRSTQFNTVQQGLTLMSEPCLYCHYANLWHVFCEVL
jgi:hypothetical protein